MNQHGTAIIWHDKGILLVGPPGSGKSELAFQLIENGAILIADDQVLLAQDESGNWTATCPPAICGMIHLRDADILSVPFQESGKLNIIFKSVQPAQRLSQPPALNLPIIEADFNHPNILEFIENHLGV